MSGRRVIDTSRMGNGAIRSTRGGLLIGDERVPLEDVAVLLLGASVTISGGALTLLSRYDVVMLNCDWRGVPDLVGYAWSDNSRVAARHRAQAELSQPRRKRAWQALVKAKIHGQQHNLEDASHHAAASRLRTICEGVRSGDPTNCEAQAARIYWPNIFDDERFRRSDIVQSQQNALLDYGYTVLRGFVIRAIASAGLWPTYGIWHRSRANCAPLADDLIEPFRPALDHVARLLGPTASLDDRAVKKALVEATSMPMGADGATVASRITELASELALYCEGRRERLAVPVWTPRASPVGSEPSLATSGVEGG
jgi:CRISP-associated protein Cas1